MLCKMDSTPVSSGSKSSDFSIERILSDRPRSETESPSWLCCTRYQPPRLPRNSSASRAVRRAGRHARVPFTGAQAAALEAAYSRAPYLAPPALKALAQALQLRDDRIKIWFQNRRARERREKSTTIAPPNSITLLPTTSAPRIPQSSSQPSPSLSQPVLTIAQRRTICQWQQCTVVGNINHINISSFASRMQSSRLDRQVLNRDNSDCSDSSVDVENVDD